MLTKTHLQTLRRSPVDKTRIAKAVELAGITQLALSRDLRFPQSYVCDVARGRFRTITVKNARKFASYFNCRIEDLFPTDNDAPA